MKTVARGVVLSLLGVLLAALALVAPGQTALAEVRAFARPLAHVVAARPAPGAPVGLAAGRTEFRSFWSDSLQRAQPYLVHLPPGYDANPNADYPVLYLLHGKNATYRFWEDMGLPDVADRLVLAGEIQPFIIVMPDGENAYWVNHANNGPRWGDYIGRDLVAEIDARFRTRPDRESRAVGGVSMGGCGALQLGMNYSSVFGIVGAHSPALRTHDTAPSYFGDLAYFNSHSPVPLFKAQPQKARSLRIWMDMGQQDVWHGPALAFHQQLVQEGIPHQWRDRPGGHDGAYWGGHEEEYVRYYDSAFRRPAAWLDRRARPGIWTRTEQTVLYKNRAE